MLCCVAFRLVQFSNASHLFGYISADFLAEKYEYSVERAAWLSSLLNVTAIFFTPVAGYIVDRGRSLAVRCEQESEF